MFDIRWIRDNPDAFDAALTSRGLEPQAASLIALDEARRKHITQLNDLQARRNAASKEIGAAKKAKDEAKASALMAEVAELKDKISAGEAEEKELSGKLEAALAVLPNMPRERPGDMLAHERGWIIGARTQRADDRIARRCVAERDCDIAQPAFVTDAPDRAAFRLLQKLLLAPAEERDQ